MHLFNRLFLNIGAMKAGTSWLFELLKDHPDISTVPIKEIHYFWEHHGEFRLLTDRQRVETARYHLNRLLPTTDIRSVPALLDWSKRYLADPVDDAWLANLFPRRGDAAYCAEFSNMYALLPSAGWEHIQAIAGEVRVSYGLRAPLPRMWSHARFHAGIIGQHAAMPSWSAAEFSEFLRDSGCLRHGAYSQTLQALDQSLGRSNYLIWFFEDIAADPAALLASFERFLGLPPIAYAADRLVVRHNPTEWSAPPPAFIAAAEPFIERELDSLSRFNLAIPTSWADPLCHGSAANFS